MKNRKKLLVIMPLVIIMSGVLLGIIGLLGGAVSKYKEQLEFTDFEANIQSGSIFNLDIDISLANVNLISTNELTDFKIEANDVTKDLINYTTTNNTLKLRYEMQKWYHAIYAPAYRSKNGSINIYIPASIKLSDVEVEASYGDISINYLTADRVFVTSGDGNCNIKGMNCSYTNITDKDGDFKSVNISAENADLHLSNDNAILNNFVSSSLIMESHGTDVDFSGIITGNSGFSAIGGDVNVTMYGAVSDYSFELLEGDSLVNDKEPSVNKKAEYTIKLNGDINVSVKD